ncbi:regulator of nonsense transcripts 1-like protein [Cucumis melo var. makuwa]|uniref:Regulator of nonsense transcripts 1-like protein n=1 Tax=Cucumis melo var. makuwa TaxID=1194695 RepID=A0A5D3E3E0_CUCMM|nr:regulator of nonsense transcripts 1-like protein [Cucumis melo var. makuwa]TYK30404.1 regulator of nonsense transcripts 1-like protein [Cucumis melo var. makuwa]
MLNESQTKAIASCLKTISCKHKCGIELIWGPPGTGKTMTVGILLFQLLRNQCRTVACAPTNTAIMQLATKFLALVKQMHEKKLQECFNPFTGWRHCFASMTDFLEDCILQFQDVDNDDMSFLKFVQTRFKVIASSLRDCISIFCTHVSRSVLKYNFENMSCLMSLIDSFQSLLFENWVESEELERNASLFFCTVSGSFKLYSKSLEPLKALVIDEAAQLKECECVIPMQLADIKHAILIGDECQLPAMVESNVRKFRPFI